MKKPRLLFIVSSSGCSEKLYKFHETFRNTIFQYNFLDRFVGFYLSLTHIWRSALAWDISWHSTKVIFAQMFPFYGFSLVLLMTPERNSRSFSISIVSKSQGKAIKAENGNGINYLVWPIMETESKWWRPRLGTQPTYLRQLGQLQNTIIREKRPDWKENLPD